MPPRPSSGQSDGIMHPSMNQPGMGPDRGNAVSRTTYQFAILHINIIFVHTIYMRSSVASKKIVSGMFPSRLFDWITGKTSVLVSITT